MKCWIVVTYEPLPGVDRSARLLRCGILAQELARAGDEVTWWTSTFHHVRKENRFDRSRTVEVAPGLTIQMLHAPPYRRSVSWRRVRHNRRMAGAFLDATARVTARPDVIFAAMPSLELAEAAVGFGRGRGIPVVVDARDKWPDLYLNAVPGALRGLARPALATEFRRARRLFAGATGITAISESYLTWALAYAGRPRGSADGVFPLGFPVPELSRVEVQERAARLRERFAIPADALLCTFLGAFGSSYDLRTAIAAARLLRAAGEDRLRIVLAGTGELASRLQAEAADLPNVAFTGWLDEGDAWALLRASAVGLAPYTRQALQSLPNKAFEYMAAGLPTVSSLPGELQALLAEHAVGRQYQSGDPGTLAGALCWLADHPEERLAMGRRAEALFRERFSTPVIYPALARHLREVAQGRLSTPAGEDGT